MPLCDLTHMGVIPVYNAHSALAKQQALALPVLLKALIDVGDIQQAMGKVKVKGRIERVDISDKFSLLIDYW